MLNRFTIACIALLLPLVAGAQVIVADDPSPEYPLVNQLLRSQLSGVATIDRDEPVSIPVWASPDGRLLALVSMSRISEAPTLPLAPLASSAVDWRIIDATNLFNGAVRWQLSRNLVGEISITPSMSARCAPGNDSCRTGLSPGLPSVGTGVNWSSSPSPWSFGVGASWMPGRQAGSGMAFDIESGTIASGYRAEHSAAITGHGSLLVGQDALLSFGASHARTQWSPLLLGALPSGVLNIEETAVSLGFAKGALRGTLVGRVIDSVGAMLPGSRWTLFDVGLAWRTPWQGELTLGTRSYLPLPAEPAKRDNDLSPSRVPYVQYRQDL